MSIASGAEPIPFLPHSKSFSARILGVLVAPRATFRTIARAPSWLGVLLLSCLLSAVASAVVLETTVGRFALLDRWERTAVAFGQNIDDSLYATLGRASEYGWLYAATSALATGPMLVMALSGLFFLAFRVPAAGAAVTYTQVLAVVAHAAVILALRQVVAAPLIYARETLASPLTLRMFVSGLPEASLPARFSSAIDLFAVWWLVVLAIGMSVLYRRPARRFALVFLGAYMAIAAILTIATALTGGTS